MSRESDIRKLCEEAQRRWLKPSEVLLILKHHEEYEITHLPPDRPRSGSLLLFNRRVNRYYRKDGHQWLRKKDGRASAEGHEKLKVENVDSLNCYYARGENNFFQKRIYWMLDPAHQHIALVHYLDITEGSYPGSSVPADSDSTTSCTSIYTLKLRSENGGLKGNESSTPCNSKFVELHSGIQKLIVSESPSNNNQLLIEQYDPLFERSHNILNHGRGEYVEDGTQSLLLDGLGFDEICPAFGEDSGNRPLFDNTQYLEDGYEKTHFASTSGHTTAGRNEYSSWKDPVQLFTATAFGDCSKEPSEFLLGEEPEAASGRNQQARRESFSSKPSNCHESGWLLSPKSDFAPVNIFQQDGKTDARNDLNYCNVPSCSYDSMRNSDDLIESSLDAILGRMDEPMQSLTNECFSEMGTIDKEASIDWANSTDFSADCSKPVSSNNFGMAFDSNQHLSFLGSDNSTVADNLKFNIRQISPDWAFSTECTQVILVGKFLCSPSCCDWKVMFGDIEVPSENIQEGVLRCHAPMHAPGKVTLCITSGNREACSEVREFEYLSHPSTSFSIDDYQSDTIKSKELSQLTMLVHILLYGHGKTSALIGVDVEEEIPSNNPSDVKDYILGELLKDKLQKWAASKSHEIEETHCSLSKQDQCILHLISGLGYDWALGPVLGCGIGINLRDANGWSPLHWAAHFGREKMVVALLASGASTGAVTHPTSDCPSGKTPADIAADSGHMGLAAYLSEKSLIDHLSSLKLEEREFSKTYAALEAHSTLENISEKNNFGCLEHQTSLKDSLSAVSTAVQAASRIQSTFRVYSFEKRLRASKSLDGYNVTTEEIQALSAAFASSHKRRHNSHVNNLHSAALHIQRKFRGWKGRKGFQTLRKNVVKIQAHVRGHQVRKKYKEFLWTANIFEKAVLRWYRRGAGLRGFKVEPQPVDETEDDDILKSFRRQKVYAALEEAVSKVLSLVDSPLARRQYSRMLRKYQKVKNKLYNSTEAVTTQQVDGDHTDTDDLHDLLMEGDWDFDLPSSQ